VSGSEKVSGLFLLLQPPLTFGRNMRDSAAWQRQRLVISRRQTSDQSAARYNSESWQIDKKPNLTPFYD
jgi:hypothetical protein